MSAIILPRSWFDMVTPSEAEMRNFLREYIGPDHWRVHQMRWRELFHRNAGILIAENRIPKLRKFQRGSVGITVVANAAQQGAGGGTEPALLDITNSESSVAPTAARNQIAYDVDGTIEYYFGTELVNVVYAQLTTQSDDANNHDAHWWPDEPETDIGDDYDIQYNSETEGGTGGTFFYLRDISANRTTATWYLLSTVSDDHADGSANGAIVLNRANGTAKTPNTGTATLTVDVEIRATGSGAALASHTLDLTSIGT